MVNFKQFYNKNDNDAGVTFIDIDETLFHTYAKIQVVKDGKVVKTLSNQEYNTYKLQPGESFDFGKFRDAEFFRQTSQPIPGVLNRINYMINAIKKSGRASKIILLTARGAFDDKQEFENTFRDYGVNIDELEVIMVGDINPGGDPAIKKQKVVRYYLKSGLYSRARMYDDSVDNLKAFLALKQEFPDIDFKAFRVTESNKIQTYRS